MAYFTRPVSGVGQDIEPIHYRPPQPPTDQRVIRMNLALQNIAAAVESLAPGPKFVAHLGYPTPEQLKAALDRAKMVFDGEFGRYAGAYRSLARRMEK